MKRHVMGREIVVAITKGKLDFGPQEHFFYGSSTAHRPMRALVKVTGGTGRGRGGDLMKAKFPGFKKSMAMMRKRDGQTQEEGFHWLLPFAGEYVHELIEEFGKEEDLGLRCWLLELIGSSKSPDTFDFLAGQLRGADQRLRHWAIWALNNLDTKEARTLLWQARSFIFGSPEETEAFRSDLNAIVTTDAGKKHG